MAGIRGVLRVHPGNRRYFTDDSGRAIYLSGSHTWANLQDIGPAGARPFDYGEYLAFMAGMHHNFMRLWMFEQPEQMPWTATRTLVDPLPWSRPGPGVAKDGKPKFDLGTFNEGYFKRLRERVIAAGERGIYVAVMLFQGWSLHKVPTTKNDPWPYHPFHADNNVNGVHAEYGGMDNDAKPSLHSLVNAAAVAHQEAYVRKVIDTVNDLDNVLYEIINEGGVTAWQHHMIDYIHAYEKGKARQHPVGMTHRIDPPEYNRALFASNAEWISPANEPRHLRDRAATALENYMDDPPVADGRKVILSDTDHLWGHGGDYRWVWKTFLRGHHSIFMDPWHPLYSNPNAEETPWVFKGGVCSDRRDFPDWDPLRRAMGDTRRYAEKMNLAEMLPQVDLASSRYCLANAGEEYLIYLPTGGALTVDLRDVKGDLAAEWFIPTVNRTFVLPERVKGGEYVVLHPPTMSDAVLYLKK